MLEKQFGRSQKPNFIGTKLTCQAVPNGATVYSLITEENYWDKPSRTDYTEAFDLFIEDFKKKKNIETFLLCDGICVGTNTS